MRFTDRRLTIPIYPQGGCTHTTQKSSSLPPFSIRLLRNLMVTSQVSVNRGNHTQKSECITYKQLLDAEIRISSHDTAMLALVAHERNEGGVIFQVQMRALYVGH